ncbi:hypothetical protein J518_1286 [Acinetobacter baumannii 1419130]|nr:hypothetical protein J518_1286 [Acinetobacter baumannii 1419130]
MSSWRHTPFRKDWLAKLRGSLCSWRHTSFRKNNHGYGKSLLRS